MDLTPRLDDGSAPPEGAPSDANLVLAGDWRAAAWSDRNQHPAAPRCIAEGPTGRGEAWTKSEPTAGVLQLTDVPARMGQCPVALRRNRPRLRRRHRVITVRGDGLHWELSTDGKIVRIRDVGSGRDVWRREANGQRWAADDLGPDEIAALLLWDWMDLARRLGPAVLL